MKALFYIISVILLTQSAMSQSSFELGNKAYLDAGYKKAIAHFERAIEDEPGNISAYYNLGMAHQQNKSYGKAIWAFEKVLKMDPRDQKAEEQIMHCYFELYGPESEWSSTIGPVERIIYSVSSFSWSVTCILFSILLATLIVIKSYRKNSGKRYFPFFAVTLGLALILSGYFAYQSNLYESTHSYGVITKKKVPTSLNDSAKSSGPELPEGKRLRILEFNKDGHCKVKDDNNNVYIVALENIDII